VKILGISPLDKDSTASIVVDGRVLFAAGEERFSRVKQHSGFPHQAIRAALEWTGTSLDEIDAVSYAFLPWDKEGELIRQSLEAEAEFLREFREPDLQPMLDAAEQRVPKRTSAAHGLKDPNQRMDKGSMKELFYRFAGGERGISRSVALRASSEWGTRATADHKKWHEELEAGLRDLGLLSKLKRGEHHLSHSANAYLASGFERALIVTLDGYGSGLAGSVSLGEGGKIRRLHNIKFPHSLGSFYEMVTSSLGFHPDRHAGKIVGLAAYGDPKVLADVLLARVKREPGDFKLVENLNVRFAQHLAARFPMIDVAAAYQYVLEVLATDLVRHWARETGCTNVVLSGGVTANVKMNQRIHELDEIEATFVYPNMGDGGCGSGLAMLYSWPGGTRESIRDVYWGPSYTPEQIEAELRKASLRFERPTDLTSEVARRIHAGEVVGRCDGRMEYGPRALGNRTIMYHAREPEVNQWLNKRLGRTEFMPFAPVTLWEARERCYVNLAGAEHAAEFMTMTFDCTPFMRANCPAAVHVDGTARPQLIRREINPGYYDILKEYEKLSGIPSLINTSFNMHEEPIVCSPNDAVRAFLLGNIDGLAIGPYFVPHPDRSGTEVGATSRKNEPASTSR